MSPVGRARKTQAHGKIVLRVLDLQRVTYSLAYAERIAKEPKALRFSN